MYKRQPQAVTVGFDSTWVRVEEGAGRATLKVQLSVAGVAPVTVAYAAVSGTATAADYQLQPGTLRFAPGEKSKVGPAAWSRGPALGPDRSGWGWSMGWG